MFLDNLLKSQVIWVPSRVHVEWVAAGKKERHRRTDRSTSHPDIRPRPHNWENYHCNSKNNMNIIREELNLDNISVCLSTTPSHIHTHAIYPHSNISQLQQLSKWVSELFTTTKSTMSVRPQTTYVFFKLLSIKTTTATKYDTGTINVNAKTASFTCQTGSL